MVLPAEEEKPLHTAYWWPYLVAFPPSLFLLRVRSVVSFI